MKKIITLLFALTLCNCGTTNTVTPEKYLLGNVKKQSLLDPMFATWYTPNFENYQPDTEIVKLLKANAKGVTIKLYMGTWCSDSQLQVPRFFKILQQAGISESSVSIICVDQAKTTPDGTEKLNNITNVPTFIFFKNKKEMNRIVESPITSLEVDMFKILGNGPYKPNYAQ